MSARLALLILSMAVGAAVAASGLYFGTDLFERDPLAGMQAEPAIELAVAELSPAGAEDIAAPGEPPGAELAVAEAAPSPAIGEPVEVRFGARSLGARPVSQTDAPEIAVSPATMADSSDGAQADEAGRERPKGWKTHYALLTFAESAETVEANLAGGHAARLVFGQEPREIRPFRRRVKSLGGDAADSAEDPDPASVPTENILGWKTHYAMRDLAQGIEQADVSAASEVRDGDAGRVQSPRPKTVRERAEATEQVAAVLLQSEAFLGWKTHYAVRSLAQSIEEAEISAALAARGEEAQAVPPPRPEDLREHAETAENVELSSLQAEAFLGWKTHYAVPAAVGDATDLYEGMRPRRASIDAADPAPVPPRIAIEAVEFEEPDGVTVAGRADPGARVLVYLEDESADQAVGGRETLGEAQGDEEGAWQVTGHRALPPGRYRVYAEIRDAADRTVASAERRFDRVEVVMAEEPAPVSPAEGGLADRLAELPPLGEAREAQSAAGPTTVHIERGDNLWHIAEAIYGDGFRYHDIYAFNRNQISDPDLIYPGQIFSVPVLEDAD